METWIRGVFLIGASALFSISGYAQNVETTAQNGEQSVIQPDLNRRDINDSEIDSEDFEIGLYVGVISIEDFSSDTIVGARLAYHINEDFFVEANYAQAQAGETSFEILSGGSPFLTEEERDYTYYNLSLGYNLNGEVFLTENLVFNSATYFTLGAGSTEFGGDSRFTVTLGAGYRLLITDYFAVHFDVRDHVFNSEIIGPEKSTHNIEYGVGATFFF